MYENEIKFKIANLTSLLTNLEKKNCKFTKESHQIDTVYVKQETPGIHIVSGEPVVRVRREGNKQWLTLKREISDGAFMEHELETSQSEEIFHILTNLGMKHFVEIDKERKTGTIDDFNICLDKVKNLGDFLEIEYLTELEWENELAKAKIIALANELGLDTQNIVYKTYNTLLLESIHGEDAI